ncbi:metal ABC transporter substrate-binding protein [Carnimonas bestiolae]|uniref:metal ABC transporter substrate-binding protein n=1 Tax=Carnimonas bestiolae TaxID=3402172 RepID=UPI003EDC01F2
MRNFFLSLVVAGAALVASIGSANAAPLNVVASFSVLGDVVKQVGGDRVKVSSLVPADGDPHEFEPTPRDAGRLNNADLVFLSGFGLEGWLDRLVTASGYKSHAITVSEGIKPIKAAEEDDDQHRHGGTDPHVWNNVSNVKLWVNNIEQALEKKDPAGAETYKANATRYRHQLDQLDSDIRSAIKSVPKAQRKVLTSHDALGYYGHAYGVNFLSPQGLSTSSEASARDVAALISQIKREHISAYFFENANDPRLVTQIAAATGAKPSGELYVESLSSAKGPAADYLSMMRYNTAQMVAAMKGDHH